MLFRSGNGNVIGLASQNTSGQSVSVVFTIITYSGSSEVGRSTATSICSIPSTVKPSVALSVTDAAGHYTTYGAYIQGYSKLKITATPTLAYSSPILSYAITADGKSYNSSPITTDVLQHTGTIPVTAVVTDARTRPSEIASTNVTVLEYAKPAVTVSAYRCNSSGTADQEGSYMKLGFSATITSLNGKNSATYSVSYKSTTGAATVITGTGTSFTSSVLACDSTQVWTVEVTVSDKLSSTVRAAVIPMAFTLMDFYHTGKGIALGKPATRDGFDCAMAAYFSGATAMPADMTIGGKTLLNLIYPVGSIYMSVSSTSPATFLGGTWEQIKDRFLLSSGSTYAAGATGGSATHTLTEAEMPTHLHNRIKYFENDDWTVGDYTGLGSQTTDTYSVNIAGASTNQNVKMSHWRTGSAGGGGAHNNMPPYLAVYVWKRTA